MESSLKEFKQILVFERLVVYRVPGGPVCVSNAMAEAKVS